MANRQNIKIEPMNVTWGANVAMVQGITCVGDTAAAPLNETYFWLNAVGGARHYVWFNVASGGTDPLPGGGTAVPVAVAALASAATVAAAVQTAVDALTGYTATVSGAVVTVTNVAVGYPAPAVDGLAATGFGFEILTQGSLAEDVGYIDGSIELTHEEDFVDVTSHQTGTTNLSHIRTGVQVSMTMTFKETTMAQLRKLFAFPGGAYIPEGAAKTEVFGSGSLKQFRQTFEDARKLVLHPVVLDPANKLRDVTAWSAYPQLDSLTYSGDEILTIPVTFMVYPDFAKPKPIQYICFGDSSQIA